MTPSVLYPFNHPFTGSIAGLVYAYAMGQDPRRGAQIGFGLGAAVAVLGALASKRTAFDTDIPVVEEVIGETSPALVAETVVPTPAAGSCTRVHRMRIPPGMAGYGCGYGCGCGCPSCRGAIGPSGMAGAGCGCGCGGACGSRGMAGTYRLI